MLLTRSPLSPDPKARFSLDLHVLGAPPAFVLSQDQTLREDRSSTPAGTSAGAAGWKLIQVSLSSKVASEDATGFVPPLVRTGPTEGLDRNCTLLSFQRPHPS